MNFLLSMQISPQVLFLESLNAFCEMKNQQNFPFHLKETSLRLSDESAGEVQQENEIASSKQ